MAKKSELPSEPAALRRLALKGQLVERSWLDFASSGVVPPFPPGWGESERAAMMGTLRAMFYAGAMHTSAVFLDDEAAQAIQKEIYLTLDLSSLHTKQ